MFKLDFSHAARIKAAALTKAAKFEKYIPIEAPPLKDGDKAASNRLRQKKYRENHKREWRVKP